MKSIIFFTTILMASNGYSQDCFFLKDNYTGICETLYPDGKVKIRAKLVNGERDGEMELIYPHGLTRAVGTFENDTLISSVSFHYHSNTRLQWKVTFKDGSYYGIQYSSLGITMNEGELNEEMQPIGEWIIYNEEGLESKKVNAIEHPEEIVFNRNPKVSRFPDTRVADHK